MTKKVVLRSVAIEPSNRVGTRLSLPKLRVIRDKLNVTADQLVRDLIPPVQKMRKTKQEILDRDNKRREEGSISDRMFNASNRKHSKDLEMLKSIEAALFTASNSAEEALGVLTDYVGKI